MHYPTLLERTEPSVSLRNMIEGIARAHVAPTFTRGFRGDVCDGDSIETHYDGFRIVARIEHDQDSHIDDTDCWPAEYRVDVFGEDTPEHRAHFNEALAARNAWLRNEWHYVGVVLSVTRDGVMLAEHAASLWGIECNYPGSNNGYLTVVANELLPGALDAAARATLAKLAEPKRAIRFYASTRAHAIETMIDTVGLVEVLYIVANVCAEKSEHIRASYDDKALAGGWNRASMRVQRCAKSADVQELIQ